MLINITMARRSLDFSGLSATLFSPLFYALFLIMLILGLNHLGYLLLRSWFFCCFLTPKNIEGPRWLVHYFPTVTLNMMQNSGINSIRKVIFCFSDPLLSNFQNFFTFEHKVPFL